MVLDYPDWQRGIRLVGADITLDIRIEASEVDLNIIFTDQSVAVWGAAAWFARMGAQVFVVGQLPRDPGVSCTVASRTVPTGNTFYIAGLGWGVEGFTVPTMLWAAFFVAGSWVAHKGSVVGDSIIFDVPIKATEGQLVTLCLGDQGPGVTGMVGSFWGWDEED